MQDSPGARTVPALAGLGARRPTGASAAAPAWADTPGLMGIPSTRLLLVEELVGGSPEETQGWLVFQGGGRGGGTAEQGQLAWPHANPWLAVVPP